MKKMMGLIFALFAFLIGIPIVSATCSAEESNKLNSLAVNVKANYEVIEKEIAVDDNFNPPDGLSEEQLNSYKYIRKFFKISINNVTEELYIKVTNDKTKETTTYSFNNAVDGVISFEEGITTDITNYTIVVYSSSATNCADTKLYTTYLTTPKYNSLSESVLCEGIEDFYMCHPYLSVDASFENYEQKIEQYREGKINSDGENIENNEEKKESFIDFIKNNKGMVITITIVVIAIGGLVTVIIVKKQRSKII